MDAIPNDLTAFGSYAPHGLVAAILAATRRCPHSWAGRRRAFFLRSIAVRSLRGRPLDVESLGARMRLYPYKNVCEKRILFTPQFFDADERALLASRIGPEFTFIDVGANIGGYTMFVAGLAGPRARILAIEPQPDIFERLVYNIRQNPFATVKALDCAVADRECEITLFVHPRNRGETSMRLVHADAADHMKVAAKPLRAILEQEDFPRIDAIKLDVEGAGEIILDPFFREAPERLWPKLLITEIAGAEALRALLVERGYRETLRTAGNLILERAGDGGRG